MTAAAPDLLGQEAEYDPSPRPCCSPPQIWFRSSPPPIREPLTCSVHERQTEIGATGSKSISPMLVLDHDPNTHAGSSSAAGTPENENHLGHSDQQDGRCARPVGRTGHDASSAFKNEGDHSPVHTDGALPGRASPPPLRLNTSGIGPLAKLHGPGDLLTNPITRWDRRARHERCGYRCGA
jgi:hypothetical protein